MGYEEFRALVGRMREAQRRYFAAEYGTPAKSMALRDSKKFEAQVDASLRQMETPDPNGQEGLGL